MTDLTRTTPQWLQQPEYAGIKVLDPDGWDRTNLHDAFAEPITKAEFERRLMLSACQFPDGYLVRTN